MAGDHISIVTGQNQIGEAERPDAAGDLRDLGIAVVHFGQRNNNA